MYGPMRERSSLTIVLYLTNHFRRRAASSIVHSKLEMTCGSNFRSKEENAQLQDSLLCSADRCSSTVMRCFQSREHRDNSVRASS